jgi:hypothetical protein
MTRLPGAHYSRRAEEALARGECVDPESIDVSAAPAKPCAECGGYGKTYAEFDYPRFMIPCPACELRAREGRVG